MFKEGRPPLGAVKKHCVFFYGGLNNDGRRSRPLWGQFFICKIKNGGLDNAEPAEPLSVGYRGNLAPRNVSNQVHKTMKSGALLRNGRSPARKRKLNEKMLRSSKAEMPMPPLGAVFYLQDKKRGIRQCLRLQSKCKRLFHNSSSKI